MHWIEKVAQLHLFVYLYLLYIQPLAQIAKNIKYDPPKCFLEDVRVVHLSLRLELKSDLGLEKVGDHWSTVLNLLQFFCFI